MALRIIALDIETDTDATPVDPAVPAGLDPRAAAVISAAVHDTSNGESVVFDGDEEKLLLELSEWMAPGPSGLIVTWNGANFDLPYLAARCELHGVESGLRLAPATDRPPKYEPLPGGHPTGYWGRWFHHGHLDVAYAYRDLATAAGITWSLKPVCEHLGIEMVHVDRAAVAQLSVEELHAYNISDVVGTAALAERLDTVELAALCDPMVP